MRLLHTVVAIVALTGYGTAAGPDDVHLRQDPSSALYTASAFAHGFRHGYEEGFHAADRDLHLSRFSLSDLQPEHSPRVVGYRPGFGSKDRFGKGFTAGFKAGYEDSAKSRDFRVIVAAAGVTVQDRDFDSGVEAGALTNAGCGVGMSRSYCAGLRVGRELVGSERPAVTEVAAATGQK